MIIAKLEFECFEDTTMTAAERAISGVITELKYNGQIIGQEFPTLLKEGAFVTQILCHEEDSLAYSNHNQAVKNAISDLNKAGILQPKITILGQDIHCDTTDPKHQPQWQVLYTSYVQTCSPLRCGDHFSPIPLYRQPPLANGCYKQLINWQQDWQACDQLQMNGRSAEFAALAEISELTSSLTQRGLALRDKISQLSGISTYYYLYRVGGKDEASERSRRCPGCDGDWALPEPLHQVIDFKCDSCKIVSNISWDYNS
ncbi:MAG: Zn-ribbon-containing protein [Gammaproteobacteria bacterium]|nr:Zn-ribbon-containing protein [Gammaproteobacteria bacterium]